MDRVTRRHTVRQLAIIGTHTTISSELRCLWEQKFQAISRSGLQHSLYLTVCRFICRRQRQCGGRDTEFFEKAFQPGRSEENERPQLLRFDREGVRDISWQADQRSRRRLEGAIADRNGHLALQYI